MIRTVAIACVAAGLTACAVGPDAKRPDAPVPAQFKEAADWKTAQPADAVARGPWWAAFGDPDLDALMPQVEAANQNLRAAEARYRQATALARQARASLLPTVTANASMTRSGSGATATRSTGNGATSLSASTLTSNPSNTGNASVALDWELDLWGRVRRTVEADAASAQASLADLASTTLSLQAELASDYVSLRIADAQQGLLDEEVEAYARSLQLTKNRYAVGVVTRADVALAQAQLEQTRAQAIDTGVQRAQLEHAIAVVIGQPPATFTLAPKPLAIALPDVPPLLPSALLERRPDIAAAERRVAAANAQIGVAQAAWFPTLTLSASGGYRGALPWAQILSAPNQVWSIGPALAETLFDGGARSARKAQATAAWDESVATYRQTVLDALAQVEDALVALRLLEQETAAQDAAVQAARESLDLTTHQYQAGTVSYLNVVTAQATELSSRRTALELAGRRLNASVQLVKALGGGWSERTLHTADSR